MRIAPLAAAVLALVAAPVVAADGPDELVEIKNGAQPALAPDKAYLLFRLPRFKGVPKIEPVFLRKPSAEELERYDAAKALAFQEALPDLTRDYQRALEKRGEETERGRNSDRPTPPQPSLATFDFTWDEVANLQEVDFGDAFAESERENTYLVETPPGEYVVYGMTPAMGLPRLVTCFCLGSVEFAAKGGEITDLGTIYGDIARSRSDVPLLAAESGYGPSSDIGIGGVLLTGTVRPYESGNSLPAGLDRSRVVPATYQAVGKYFTPSALGINRMVPVPGILDYDRGNVIDVRTGRKVPDNF